MDRGIATEECVKCLREHEYRYLVVSRERTRHFDPEAAQRIETVQRQGRACAQGLVRRHPGGAPALLLRGARQHRERASWDTVRRILEGHQRITATFARADGRIMHVRKATRAEPPQQAIYDALGVDPEPGGICKTIV